MTKTLPFSSAQSPNAARVLAVLVLRACSAGLDRLAQRLAATPVRAAHVMTLPLTVEYHAEAGAPEGALYVDGVLYGHLPVTRL